MKGRAAGSPHISAGSSNGSEPQEAADELAEHRQMKRDHLQTAEPKRIPVAYGGAKRIRAGVYMLLVFQVSGCFTAPEPTRAEVEIPKLPALLQKCDAALNICADYSGSWRESCAPDGRCLRFKNSCPKSVALSYEIGCNGDGSPGAPQCSCEHGPVVETGQSVYWQIVDADYEECLPSFKPACLTRDLLVIANYEPSCTGGSLVGFDSGNRADSYHQWDSYNLNFPGGSSATPQAPPAGIPSSFRPDLTHPASGQRHDCKSAWCNAADCCNEEIGPLTAAECPRLRPPSTSCDDAFIERAGYTVEFCPSKPSSPQENISPSGKG